MEIFLAKKQDFFQKASERSYGYRLGTILFYTF